MNLVLEFLPEAEAEAQCVTGDYEAKVPGLGARFRHELEDACSAMVQHPAALAAAGRRLASGEPARLPLLHRVHHS